MKKISYLLVILFTVSVSAQDWKETYSEALTAAQKENKNLVLVFSGSDWCAPCIRLERNIWKSDEFIAFAKENYILYKADFPRKKNNQLPDSIVDQNKILTVKYNPKSYLPLVVLLNSEEKVLGETGYEKLTPFQYISLLNSFVK